MKAFLNRYHMSDKVTLGTLNIEGITHPPLFTLELPWLENKNNISCIPEGIYHCRIHNGPKYKDVYELCNVSGRTAILIHVGNYLSNTDGCILVGLGVIPEKPMVTNSAIALLQLMEITGGKEFDLRIRNN